MKTYLLLLQYVLGEKKFLLPLLSSTPPSSPSQLDIWKNILYNKGVASDNVINSMIYLYLSTFISKLDLNMRDFIKHKFHEIENTILRNMFVTENIRTQILEIISKAQRHYRAISRLAYLWKFKRAPLQVTADLYMNEIDPTRLNIFTLFQNGSKYYFAISDLINIINNNLLNAHHFFSDPCVSKNPYNNVEFSNCDLYNIYFFIKSRNIVMPRLIEGFFQCNLSLDEFEMEYESFLRDTSIHNHVYKSNESVLYGSVMHMLENECIEYTRILHIDDDFPKKTLVEIMRPYLHLYYLTLYYIDGTIKKSNAGLLLKKKLRLFVKFNPKFGRRKMVRQPFTTKYELSYNSEHINFYGQYEESDFEPIHHLLRYDSDREEDSDYDVDDLNNAILFINQTTRESSSSSDDTTNNGVTTEDTANEDTANVVNFLEPHGDY
jgi:hypothetical protein